MKKTLKRYQDILITFCLLEFNLILITYHRIFLKGSSIRVEAVSIVKLKYGSTLSSVPDLTNIELTRNTLHCSNVDQNDIVQLLDHFITLVIIHRCL